MNFFGEKYRFTSFGESHGPAIGGVLDGVPAGLKLDTQAVQDALKRRANGVGGSTRAAREADEVEWLSGLKDGVTLGSPIAFVIRNTDARSADYAELKDVFRPGHADLAYYLKYGLRDERGGGRASARETAARVVAGSVAEQMLKEQGIAVEARLVRVAGEEVSAERTVEAILQDAMAAHPGDSFGGIIACTVKGLPAGVGEPLYEKLQAQLAAAMLSIPACKGFEYGHGFASADMRGSEANAYSGGISGGISDGNDVHFRVVMKPTPSIALPQKMLTATGEYREVQIHGRHDVAVVVRAVEVVRAMTAIVLANAM